MSSKNYSERLYLNTSQFKFLLEKNCFDMRLKEEYMDTEQSKMAPSQTFTLQYEFKEVNMSIQEVRGSALKDVKGVYMRMVREMEDQG